MCLGLIVASLASPARQALAAGLSTSAVIRLASVLDPTLTPSDASDPILQPLLATFSLMVVAAGLRRLAAHAVRDETTAGRAAMHAARLQARRPLDEESMRQVWTSTASFFQAVVGGVLDVRSVEVREHASALAQQARDELYLHDLIDDDLRLLLATVRESGCRVTIRYTDEVPADSPAAELLRHCLDPSTTHADGLSLPSTDAPYTRLVVEPELTEERASLVRDGLGHLDHDVTSGIGVSVVTVRQTGSSTARHVDHVAHSTQVTTR